MFDQSENSVKLPQKKIQHCSYNQLEMHSKSETVKSHYFPNKIAPVVSFSDAVLLGKQ